MNPGLVVEDCNPQQFRRLRQEDSKFEVCLG